MKNLLVPLSLCVFITPALAQDLPRKYIDLLPYVQRGPDQGETNTCLFHAATGAMELLANKKHDIKNPVSHGPYDLSESYTINAPSHHSSSGKSSWEAAVLKYNGVKGVHISSWEFEAWSGPYINNTVWNYRDSSSMKRVDLPKVQTQRLFVFGNRWSTKVLNESHIEMIKRALVQERSPILVNYNDDGYWHVVLIVGYDDDIPGSCHGVDPRDCSDDPGSFYVRDSFGMKVEVRDQEWFKAMGNAAFVVKEAQ
jgi:hypothetical protein